MKSLRLDEDLTFSGKVVLFLCALILWARFSVEDWWNRVIIHLSLKN